MAQTRSQFSIRDMLIAIALFSTATYLDLRLQQAGHQALGPVAAAILIGGSYGVLTHRLWRGVLLGLAAIGVLLCFGVISWLFFGPRVH